MLSKAAVLRDLNRLSERLEILETEGTGIDAEPLVAQSLAQVLLPNPDRQEEAGRLLRRSVRSRPLAAAGYYLLATQWWEERRFVDAAEVYRFACTLDDREDQFAEAYFRAARATEQVPEALRLFQQKAGRAAIPLRPRHALFHASWTATSRTSSRGARSSDPKLQETGDRRQERERPETRIHGHSSSAICSFSAECHASAGRHALAETDPRPRGRSFQPRCGTKQSGESHASSLISPRPAHTISKS